MKHFHPHSARIDYLKKQIEQDGYMLEEYRRDQADAQAKYLRPETKYTEMREIADGMRSRTGKIATIEKSITAAKKELETLEKSIEKP